MPLARRLGDFLVPWLAFAILGGLGGALVGGILTSVIGLVYGIITLIGGVADKHLWAAIGSMAHSFPNYAVMVLVAVAFFFAVSFLLALIMALMGGSAGLTWGLISIFGSICFTNSFFQGYYSNIGSFVSIPGLIVAGVGMVIPAQLLELKEPRYSWDGPLRRWLRSTWLLHPPQIARMSSIALPIAFCVCLDIHFTLPTYLANQNYATRLNKWTVWQNSTRVACRSGLYARSSCQSNLKQIMLGALQYQEDYDGYYPPKPASPMNGPAAVIYPYARTNWIFQCPGEFYMSDSSDPRNPDYTDYWFNARLFALNGTKLPAASATVTFGDGNTGVGEADAAYSLQNVPPNFPPSLRHSKGANYAFADGHVRWMAPGLVSNTVKSSMGSPTMNP